VAIGFFWLAIPTNAVGLATKKRMSEGESPGRYFGGGIALNALLALGLAGLVLLGATVLASLPVGDREFVTVVVTYDLEIAALVVGAGAIRTVLTGLQGQKRVARAGILKAIERSGRTAVQVLLLLVGLGVTGLIVGHAASLLLVAALGLAVSHVRPLLPRPRHLVRLLSYARYAWLSVLRGRVFGWLDTLMLSFFVSATLIGIYEAAWGIASLLAMAGASISNTLFPEVSDLSTQDDYDRIKHYLDEALAFGGIFVVPGLFGAVVIGERILQFYRPEFGQGAGILVVLVTAYVADVYGSQLLSVINAIDSPDVAFRVNTLFIAVNAALNVVLIWQIGWFGAAIATAVSSWLRMLAGYRSLVALVGPLSIPTGAIGREVFAAAVMAGVVVPVADVAPYGRVWTLAIVGLGATVYTLVLLVVSQRIREKFLALVPRSVPVPV
ncbi:MAG: lipopolysaccharide biosynthesis protein, partial [Haloarculaceae archaeon]